MEILSDHGMAALAGAGGGIVLGLAARLARFCTLGAIEDTLYGGSSLRLRMWALALGTAVAGVFVCQALGLIAIEASVYASRAWNPVASVAGGLVFGYGMAISGGFGALARLGGGDLRSLIIVIVMGVAAYATLVGPLAPLRLWLFAPTPAEGMAAYGPAHWISAQTGMPMLVQALAAAGALAAWALADAGLRADGRAAFWSVAVGAAIVFGWVATTWLARTGFDAVAVESHSFVAPAGETTLWLMTASVGGMGFSIGSVLGVIAGAFIGCAILGQFRWEACDDARELGRQIGGAALMGTGGVVAVGCSIGQGMSTFSTLAFSGPVVLAAIFCGAALGLRQLIQGSPLPWRWVQ